MERGSSHLSYLPVRTADEPRRQRSSRSTAVEHTLTKRAIPKRREHRCANREAGGAHVIIAVILLRLSTPLHGRPIHVDTQNQHTPQGRFLFQHNPGGTKRALADSEWESRHYLDISPLEKRESCRQPRNRCNLRKNLDAPCLFDGLLIYRCR